MRSLMMELARMGGRIALEHFQHTGMATYTRKGRSDYVTHVDRRVEQAIVSRIHANYPDHQILAEEAASEAAPDITGPCWIIDPIDGTTNFIRGMAGWGVSICFCDEVGRARHAAIYDPMRDELFTAERGAGLWLGDRRVYSSGCTALEEAIVAQSLPFRVRESLDEVAEVAVDLQRRIDDMRRTGSAALELAYVAVGRLDAYWELGIHSWDIAAGMLMVHAGGGRASDLRGADDDLLHQRSVVAAATPALHGQLLRYVGGLAHWLDHDAYRGV